jgi:hypothetical protein
MIFPPEYATGAAIIFIGVMLLGALDRGFRRIADRIHNNSRLLDRVGTKIDELRERISQ